MLLDVFAFSVQRAGVQAAVCKPDAARIGLDLEGYVGRGGGGVILFPFPLIRLDFAERPVRCHATRPLLRVLLPRGCTLPYLGCHQAMSIFDGGHPTYLALEPLDAPVAHNRGNVLMHCCVRIVAAVADVPDASRRTGGILQLLGISTDYLSLATD